MFSVEKKSPYRKKEILTGNELEFFNRIRKAVPDLYIFPQVSMSALIEPTASGKDWQAAFGRISQKRIDYGIYTQDFQLVVIIELDDRTHDKSKDEIRDSYTGSAGIKTLRFESKSKPTIAKIRDSIHKLMD